MNELNWLKHREIIWSFYRAANAYCSVSKKRYICGDTSFTPVEIQIIEHILLYSEELHNMKWYAEQIGVSASTLTHYINDLEKRGIIEKYHTESNRKNIILHISEKGINDYREYVKQAIGFFSQIFGDMDQISHEDQILISKILNRWADAHLFDVIKHPEALIRI